MASAIRDKPIYLSSDVWRALWLLSEASVYATDQRFGIEKATPDEIADTQLRKFLEANHPEILTHLGEITSFRNESQKKLIQQLREKSNEINK